MIDKEAARQAFHNAAQALKDAGLNVVYVVSEYRPRNWAHFDTRISVHDQPELGTNLEHVLGDAMREIWNNWSEIVHVKPKKKLTNEMLVRSLVQAARKKK